MEPKKIHADLAEAMADTLVRSNPLMAKDFCDSAGVEFDAIVAALLSEAHEDRSKWSVYPFDQVFGLCANQEWVISDAYQWPLTEHTIRFLAQVVPDVLTVRREELLDWLLSAEGRWMGEVRSFLSAGEVIGRLNGDPRIRELPRAEMAEKVGIAVSSVKCKCQNPGLDSELWQAFVIEEVLYFFDSLIQDKTSPTRLLWEGLSSDEQPLVIKEAVATLIAEEKYPEAARLAEFACYSDLEAQAAALAYERCCSGNQWREAAQLARRFGLQDIRQAAKKELARLQKERNASEAVQWADDYELAIPLALAERYFRHRNEKGYQEERAADLVLEAGKTELAREVIVEVWKKYRVSALRYPKSVELLDHYRQPGGVFSGDDAIADLSVILAALGEQEAESQFLSLLETLGLADVKPAIVSQAVKEIISDRAKTEAERFVADHFPCSRAALSVTALSEIAERVAVEQARKRDWRGFLRLCQEWELATLLAIVADLEKLLPEEERPTEPPGDRFARAAGISV